MPLYYIQSGLECILLLLLLLDPAQTYATDHWEMSPQKQQCYGWKDFQIHTTILYLEIAPHIIITALFTVSVA